MPITIDENSARRVWDRANEQLASMPAQEILKRNRVTVVCTTDDPTDSLEHHKKISSQGGFKTRVYPTFRPDKALAVDQPEAWNAWVDKLSAASNIECNNFTNFLGPAGFGSA